MFIYRAGGLYRAPVLLFCSILWFVISCVPRSELIDVAEMFDLVSSSEVETRPAPGSI